MKRGLLILIFGVVGFAATLCCVYFLATATTRALLVSPQPELAWLKREFKLTDTEFKRISELHAGYLPQCKERCRRIEELNNKVSDVLARATHVTPEIENLLHERARVRASCQAEMLKHFFEVSRTMPPEQGKRYFAWARENTCLREHAMDHGPESHGNKDTSSQHP